MNRDRWLSLAVATLVVLFFLQALRVLFSMLFGILYDEIFAGTPTAWLPISLALVVAALVAPFVTPARHGDLLPRAAAIVAALSRIVLTVNDAGVRYWGSLLVIAAGGIFVACLHQQERRGAWTVWVLGFGLDQLLRTAGHTFDLSLQSSFLSGQVILSIAVAAGAAVSVWASPPGPSGGRAPGWLAVSFGGLLFLETSLLSVANATARWSGSSYEILAPLTLAVTLFGLHPSVVRAALHGARPRILFVLLPVGLLLGRSLGAISAVSLLVALGCSLLAWWVWAEAVPGGVRAGKIIGWGMAFFLLLNFLNAFTFTYPYTLPVLRGLGWAVYLIAGLAAGLPLLFGRFEPASGRATLAPVVVGLAAVAASLWLTRPAPLETEIDVRAVRVATYNIHYGYDEAWRFNLAEQADALREAGVDAVTLQEVDTGRMTSFMADDAYYLAQRLGMRAVYLPTVERLTGIAVLTRGGSGVFETGLLTSLQEQTGIIHVPLATSAGDLHIFGIWMGLSDEDTGRQVGEALDFIDASSPAVFGGDFNAEPGSPVHEAVLAAGFHDPFQVLGLEPAPTSPAVDPKERIDYVFLRGLGPRSAFVSDSLASDHRMVVTEIDLTAPPVPGLARMAR